MLAEKLYVALEINFKSSGFCLSPFRAGMGQTLYTPSHSLLNTSPVVRRGAKEGGGGEVPATGTTLGHKKGGCKTYGGRKTYRTTHPPDNFCAPQMSVWPGQSSAFLQGKSSNDVREGWKTYRMMGGPKPLFLGGVSFVRFSLPLLFPPPSLASSDDTPS